MDYSEIKCIEIKSKTGYIIKLYSSTKCEKTDLIKTIELPQIGGITIDGKEYALTNKEFPIYTDMYKIIHKQILKEY